ncbi:hypothetical protein WA158_007363 [Blastocystis sp. Blastoise]
MSDTEFHFTDNKYLFSFQDETQLWISREFLEKYPQLPFYDIIKHSEKYEDGSYYIDIPSSPMNKVFSFLMDKNMDISSLNLRDSYDIYCTLVEYPAVINLITPQQQEELLYYSFLIKMMKITKVDIEYLYASNISLEYICPSCIKDIFPSLEELIINVNSNYKKSELLLNPNSDEYIMEYIRVVNRFSMNSEKYEYYTESEMNEYNKISTLDLNNMYYSSELIDSITEKKQKNELPKLYEYMLSEAIYIDDYSSVEYVKLQMNIIKNVNTEMDYYTRYQLKCFRKMLEEGVFDGVTILNISWIKNLIDRIDDNLLNSIITTHVFPYVTELIYDDDGSFPLSSIKKECFPKLHIIKYDTEMINVSNFESLFPMDLISMVDTIHIYTNKFKQDEEVAIHKIILNFPHLKELIEKELISLDTICIDSSDFKNIRKLDYFMNYKHNISCLDITFKNCKEHINDDQVNEMDMRNSLEQFLKSNVIQHLDKLNLSFDENISLEYLEWISTLLNNNGFYAFHELSFNLCCINKDSSSEYFTIFNNILSKLIPKASIVNIGNCYLTDINQLISKGCFCNTTELTLEIRDLPDDSFLEVYTKEYFPQLKSIKLCKCDSNEWWSAFILEFIKYINNKDFLSSTTVLLHYISRFYQDYIYDLYTSVFRFKYDTNSFMDTIKCTGEQHIRQYEIEALFDCINENKTKNLRSLRTYVKFDEELSKLINNIANEKIPKLEEFICYYYGDYISDEQASMCYQQLKTSPFIQENHLFYKLERME